MRIVPATGPDDTPPNSSRVEIYAQSQEDAESIAFGRNDGRPGTYRVFPLPAAPVIPQGITDASSTPKE